jgi:hypothetical protein
MHTHPINKLSLGDKNGREETFRRKRSSSLGETS